LINEADDLNVVGCFEELDTLECAVWDETGTVPGFGAPRDHFTLNLTDGHVGLGRGPEAEVVWAIEEGCLAEGILVFGGAVADVVAQLCASDEPLVGVYHVWDAARKGKVLGGEGYSGEGASDLGVDDDDGEGESSEVVKNGGRHGCLWDVE